MSKFRKLIADRQGTAAVEYGLICALMVIGLIVGVEGLGASVKTSYQDTGTKMHNASAG